ncbi:MAG: BON domain-containing protein [Anaerolineales bacterium]|jgi:osmotically-inducible protein OsmY|nr:BON domain-containing protein [Anaerolineales bacterium]
MTPSKDLTQNILTALRNDPHTKDEVIEVVETAGTVTLSGYVKDVETRERAEKIARQDSGVLSVINELVVQA